jgi:hypothetical protein
MTRCRCRSSPSFGSTRRELFDSGVPPPVRSHEAPWFARRWRPWSSRPPLPLATGLHASVPVRRRKPASDGAEQMYTDRSRPLKAAERDQARRRRTQLHGHFDPRSRIRPCRPDLQAHRESFALSRSLFLGCVGTGRRYAERRGAGCCWWPLGPWSPRQPWSGRNAPSGAQHQRAAQVEGKRQQLQLRRVARQPAAACRIESQNQRLCKALTRDHRGHGGCCAPPGRRNRPRYVRESGSGSARRLTPEFPDRRP